MEKPESLIGRKIKGFKFDESKFPAIGYMEDMDKFIDQIGTIEFANNIMVRVTFDSDEAGWAYPASLIEAHLIPEETNSPNKAMTLKEKLINHDHLRLVPHLHKDIIHLFSEYHSQQSWADQKERAELKRKVEDQEAIIEGQAMRIGMYRNVDSQIESLESEIFTEKEKSAKLVEALKQATERMERARNILKKQGANWGMLDTSDLTPILKDYEAK